MRQYPVIPQDISGIEKIRFHKCGCRNPFARLRRALPKFCRTLPGIAHGETGARISENVCSILSPPSVDINSNVKSEFEEFEE